MQIDMKNAVVIFDEGHNVEGASRDAASFSLRENDVENAIADLQLVKCFGVISVRTAVQSVHQVLKTLLAWVRSVGQSLKNINKPFADYADDKMMTALHVVGLGFSQFQNYKTNLETIYNDKFTPQTRTDTAKTARGPQYHSNRKVSSPTLLLLNGLQVVLDYLYGSERPDYHMVIAKEHTRVPAVSQNIPVGHQHHGMNWSLVLHFWCMNPAVAFRDFQQCRSVIITSGTLSPLGTFQSELKMNFEVQFEANHVIDDKQIWAAAIGFGPVGPALLGTWKNMLNPAYQDGIGNSIWQICRIVPKGILCFFPSYSALSILMARWKSTGVLSSIKERKVVVREESGSNTTAEFEQTLREYYGAVRGEQSQEGQDGALMLAVCRGKISEGLDFADDNARAVIVIGIPFPTWSDPQIQMKMKFNDRLKGEGKNVLSGSDWYAIQGYRPVSQALGRCLRHKDDWGALILLDNRFVEAKNRHFEGLPKWMRYEVKFHSKNHFDNAMHRLRHFFDERLPRNSNQPVPMLSASFAASDVSFTGFD